MRKGTSIFENRERKWDFFTTFAAKCTDMKLKFNINYNTKWGECMHVMLSYRSTDGKVNINDMPMNTVDGEKWTLDTVVMDSHKHHIETFAYYYLLEDNDGKLLRSEWNMTERVYVFDMSHSYSFVDQWRDMPLQFHLFSNAYVTSEGLKRNDIVKPVHLPIFRKTIIFRVSAPQLKKDEALAILGNHPAIGDWNITRYLRMTYMGGYDWILSVDVECIPMPIEYKYVVINTKNNALVAWEEGGNRSFMADEIVDGQVVVLYGDTLRVCESMWKAAGVVIPIFSLRSEHSYGVGDFGDLKRMVDWTVDVGMKVIQTLPINDTTSTHQWSDSYPYNSISVYALHPHYMDLEQLGALKDKTKMTAYHRQRQELNALPYSDYMAVDRVKTAYINDAFEENGQSILRSESFKKFMSANRHWLLPYAAFSVLRDKYGTAHYKDWKTCSKYNKEEIERFCMDDANQKKVEYIYYVQYNLYIQLKGASDYAREHNVVLKGDLPIGVNIDSVETWVDPFYFNMDMQTGAPPDGFSENGQNWGFPTYNWERMSHDNYRWWKDRFNFMEQFFDAFRIDHVLGFFRIWEIPKDAIFGTLGHFSPSMPMNEDEIGYFGLKFRKDLYTKPFINDSTLDKVFGIHAVYVKTNFLIKKAYGLYELKSEYDTQKKVRDYFHGRNDENSLWIRDGLYRLIANVLFVFDPRQEVMYHPRIGAYHEPVYEVLSDDDKDAYMRLYNNYFYRRHNIQWKQTALKRLPTILDNTRMLVCAEDLGMLPDCVEEVLDRLRILSLDIQTMPKETGVEFGHIGGYPYRSVATVSTHDMPPMRLWWEENHERTQRYYTTMLQKEGPAPRHLTTILAEEIVARHLYSPAMLCLLSFQDLTAMDQRLRSKDIVAERINVPADSYNRWQYRMHVTIETLMKEEQFNRKLKLMVKRSQR